MMDINVYKEHLILSEKSPATIEKYIRDITKFLIFSDGVISKEIVLKYKEYLAQNYAISSVNSMLTALQLFLKYNNIYDIDIKLFKVQKNFLSTKELTKKDFIKLLHISRKKDQRLSLLIETIALTGIRISEHVFVTVESLKKQIITINLKGKIRSIILPKLLCIKLLNYAKKSDIKQGSIFITKNKKPLNRSNVWKQLKALCDLTDVKEFKVFPHNLRHFFARNYYRLEKDIVSLANILGHSNVNTTMIYTKLSEKEYRRKLNRLEKSYYFIC